MKEVFVQVKGYEGLYEISDLGRIKILSKKVNVRNGTAIRKEKMMSLKITRGHGREGYHLATLRKDSISKMFTVHRLVALHFIPNPENKEEVNHKFGIRGDNRASELEWMTKQENMKHAYLVLKSYENRNNPLKGSLHWRAKLDEKKVYTIKERYNDGGVSIRKLANEFGVHHAIIYGIIKGKRWPHVILKTA